MEKVERYAFEDDCAGCCGCDMETRPNGAYVDASDYAALAAHMKGIIIPVDVQRAKDVVMSYFPNAVVEPWKDQWTIRITPQTSMGLGGTPEAAWMSFGIGFAKTRDAYNERAERAEAKIDAVREIVQDYAIQPSARLRRIAEIVK